MIRALVVDDSAFMRKAISMMLESDPEIKVVDTGRNGAEGVEKALALRPDVITMDVEMPVMDGITALRQIMKAQPCPVLMISSITQEGAPATVEALHAGAVDFIPKKSSYASLEITKIQADLVEKVKLVTRSKCRIWRRPAGRPEGLHAGPALHAPALQPPRLPAPTLRDARVVVIGVSTGGPFALQRVIPALPAGFALPVVVVQHMPPHFTRSLAERLDASSPLRVVEAEHGMMLTSGTVYIAPGGKHLCLKPVRDGGVTLTTNEGPEDSLHKPSVDVMFASANAVFPGHVLSVIMTGMGKDGLKGVQEIKARGGICLAQDEPTCVVYGMPRAVAEARLTDAVLPLDGLAEGICKAVGASAAPIPASAHAPRFAGA